MLAQKPYYPRVDGQISTIFASEGLHLLGVADAETNDAAATQYREWVNAGYAGDMYYLKRHAELKYRPDVILPGCQSILIAGLNYFRRAGAAGDGISGASDDLGSRAPRVARYAWGRDYHLVLGKRLRRVARQLALQHPKAEFRPYTDATPLAERYYAERAGIGFTGRNTLLISGQYGSWFLLGEILSTHRFAATSAPAGNHGACPRSCRKCIDVCPTGALLGPNRIDASRCISYLTIEHRGSIAEELRPLIGRWLFGCDLCQEVCPLNVRAHVTAEDDFLRDRAGESPALASILRLANDQEFRARFAGSPLKRPGRQGLLRNACIVAANTQRHDLLPLLMRLARDDNAVIAEHARWAVDVLENPSGSRQGADT